MLTQTDSKKTFMNSFMPMTHTYLTGMNPPVTSYPVPEIAKAYAPGNLPVWQQQQPRTQLVPPPPIVPKAFIQGNAPGQFEKRRAVSSTPGWLLPAFVGSQVAMVGLTGLALIQSAKLRDINQMTQNKVSVLSELIEHQQGPQDYLNTAYQVVNGTVEAGNENLKPVADAMQKYKKAFTVEGVTKALNDSYSVFQFLRKPAKLLLGTFMLPIKIKRKLLG